MVSMVPVPLRDICAAIEYGYTASASHDIEGPQFLRITDIVPELINWKTVPRCEIDSKKHEKFRLHHDDIVIARTGATVGYAKRLKNPPSSVFASYLVRLKIDPTQADPGFVGAIVESQDYKAFVLRNAGGAAQPNANAQVLTSYVLRLPNLPTQRRIASILSTYDDLLENNARRIAILEEMARRIYEEWFVRFRFPGHEQVKMVESELGAIPEGWELTTIGKAAANHDRKRKPLSKMQREKFKGPYPYYGAAKVFDYVQEYLFDGRFVLMAEDGSVITPDGFPVLQLANGKFWANNHTHILQGTAAASTEFIYLRLANEKISGYITGAAQPKITQENMNRIPVTLPPSNLMPQFTALVKPKFDLIHVLERKNANLRTQRDLLLPKLISGELDVSTLPEPETIAA